MAYPFRILWLDDEANVGDSSATTQWPKYLTLLVDTELATISTDAFTNYQIQSRAPQKRASFCEVYHAPQFPQALQIIASLEGKGIDCAILDVKLTKGLRSPNVLPKIAEYLEAHNTSIDIYLDENNPDAGSSETATRIEKDMWLVFWIYREIVSRFPTTPVFFYTNYKSSAEYAGMLPFMNPDGEMSPAIYDKADDRLIADRISVLLTRRRDKFLKNLPPSMIDALIKEIDTVSDCNRLLQFLTQRELFGESMSATLAELFPEQAMRAQKEDSYFLNHSKQVITDALRTALPKHNYCSVYLRYCHPSTYEWSDLPDFGVKDLLGTGYEEIEGKRPDQWKSHFELLTHPAINTVTQKAWLAAPRIAKLELEGIREVITPSARLALIELIDKSSELSFPVTRIPASIEALKKKVRVEAQDIMDAIGELEMIVDDLVVKVERRDENSFGHLYGCSESITKGVQFLADDLTSNRKARRLRIAFGDAQERPLWIALWGEFDNFSDFDEERQIMLKNAHQGQKISGAIYQLNGFFHWYQFFRDHSAATWTELLRGNWPTCISPIKEERLFRFLSGSTAAGHLLVAEGYPSLRR